MKADLVVGFDFGDTLVSYVLATEEGQLRLLHDVLQCGAYGSATADLPDLCRRLNTEHPDGAVWPFIERVRHPSFFGPDLSVHQARRLQRDLCESVFASAMPISGARTALARLRAQNAAVGIMSNLPWGTAPALWRAEIARHGYRQNIVDAVVTCGDVGFRKPHPAGLDELRRRLATPDAQLYFVGDRVSDLEAARAAGWTGILVNPEIVSDTDDLVIADISELVATIEATAGSRDGSAARPEPARAQLSGEG
jgi:FMN phosphatase YigB (HAD superfamily)